MTIICALREPGVGTWIGADSRTVLNGTPTDTVKKWVQVSESWWVGVSGQWRAMALIQRYAMRANGDDFACAGDVFKAIERAQDLAQWRGVESDGRPPFRRSGFLIASATSIFYICGEGSMVEHDGFWAAGSGADYALGAAHALGGMDAKDRMEYAIDAAVTFDVHCGGKTFIELIPETENG